MKRILLKAKTFAAYVASAVSAVVSFVAQTLITAILRNLGRVVFISLAVSAYGDETLIDTFEKVVLTLA